ncbi:hypothetical protein GW7_11400, partial [Heterocephalus glaber]
HCWWKSKSVEFFWKKFWDCDPPVLFLLATIAFAILGLFWFHMNFRISFSSSVRKVTHTLIRIALNL